VSEFGSRVWQANWFGSEAYNGPPGGLDKHSVRHYLDFLASHGFNAIRLLFNHEHILKNDIAESPVEEPLLFQVRYLEMFHIIAREAASRGILIMLACHRIKADAWPGKGLWYDDSIGFPESRVKESWSAIAKLLCSQWNVFAADLQNEPHSASWGKDMDVDWNIGAQTLGNHVLEACPRWLIMVEGVGYDPGAPGGDDPGAGFWWGENLVGVKVAPVTLSNQEKLVYSPHVYGPSVYQQHYFDDRRFPANMPEVRRRS
jgi:aryl-phospho-beta-D-glucosidase BglC (GH1 family)